MRDLPVHPTRTTYRVITSDNPKLIKTEKKKHVIATVLHFAPADLSGVNVCPFADGCKKVCLHTAGNPAFQEDKNAGRMARTKRFLTDRESFEADFVTDLVIQQAKADADGVEATHRPNGTSDIAWEVHRFDAFGGQTMFELFPRMQFMDYTKYPMSLRDTTIPNYYLIFSLSNTNENEARKAIQRGFNVAVVMAVRPGQPMPGEFWGHPVVDGDEHDLRFMDPQHSIVGLRAKGLAVGDTSGFVWSPKTGDQITMVSQWIDADRGFANHQFAKANDTSAAQNIDMPGVATAS